MNENVRMERGSVVSADGTEIGYSRFGEGAPVVVCHGAYTVADDWAAFSEALDASYTVYVYDRRGRGRSPAPGDAYSARVEIDDLAAVVRIAGPESAIVGHSLGGGCALAYALREGFGGRLVLYEPVHSILRPVSKGHLPELRARVERNDLESATAFALEHVIRMSRADIEMFRTTPLWAGMVGLTPGFVNELGFLDTLTWTPEELGLLRARTWLLLGTLTVPDPTETSAVAVLVDRIHGATLYPVLGQGHVAYLLDPSLLAKLVARCLRDE
jgi:pimeloyl-ACP methyl ester carboxylesterase